MTITVPPTNRSRRVVLRLAVPFAALSLALSACAGGGPAAEPTEQETAVQSAIPDPTSPSGATPTPTATASEAPGAVGTTALLTVAIQQDASAEPVQYTLECIDGAPGPASTLPGAEAACAALGRLGTQFFTARPSKDVICTQQYGGPQRASITGTIDGTSVLASFALTDGCEISRWDTARDILGAPGGQ
jgi:hypothetical protein